MKRLVALTILLAAFSWTAAAADNESVEITEWTVPWEDSRPRDPFVESATRVWFVGQRSDYIGLLDPETGAFRKFDLDKGTGPHNLIVDAGGTVWYAGNRAAHIGKLEAKTGNIVKIAMPNGKPRDPHTLVFNSMGDIWFTAQGANMVSRLTVKSGDVAVADVPTPRARPYGIFVDGNDRPWIAQFGTNKIGTVDPATMTYREISLPRADARPRRLDVASDGAIWYVDYAEGYLGRLDPATEQVEEWLLPAGGNSKPYAMAIDGNDRVWVFETGPRPNRLVGFDATTRKFFSTTEVGSGGGTVRHMVYHAGTGSLWFGTDTNTIGRARID